MQPVPALFSSIGPGELVLIFLVLLLIFGPRLPEVGRSLGIGIKEFKDGMKGETMSDGDAAASQKSGGAGDDTGEAGERPG